MTPDHTMTCPCRGYPITQHNEIRDVLAEVMSEVIYDVEVEPQLLSYAEEDLSGRTANCSSEACVDIRARGFWTFFDIRVTHPKACLLSCPEVLGQLESNEREKKIQYAERINTVDRGVFTPLVSSTAGMTGHECGRYLKSLVSLIVSNLRTSICATQR